MYLTIYSIDFDKDENVAGSGLSEKIFIEDGKVGSLFKNVYDALNYAVENDIEFDHILYCYRKNNNQMFKKFILKSII